MPISSASSAQECKLVIISPSGQYRPAVPGRLALAVSASTEIEAGRGDVWRIISDIDSAAQNITAILDIEVLERAPAADSVLGLKWTETRKMFGKEARETMTVVAEKPGYWYETRAQNHGTVYTSKMEIQEASNPDKCTLIMSFDHQPLSLGARLMSIFSFLFEGSIKKAFAQDLADIKRVAES